MIILKIKGKSKVIFSLLVAGCISSDLLCCTSSYANSTNLIDINFGDLLTLQEENGYVAFTGKNMLENFNQAKAELPQEIPLLSPFEASGENVFFVSVTGDDSSEGSEEKPLATLNEALNRVKKLTQAERERGSVIYIRGGEYHIKDTISVTSEHTSENSTLFICGYPNESVTFSAEESISLSKAEKVALNNTNVVTYSRINNNAVGNLYFINYEDMKCEKIPYESSFYINDIPMYPARYPNSGEDTISQIIKDGSYTDGEGFVRTGLPMEWEPLDSRPFTWSDTGNIHIFGRVANEWSYNDGIVWLDKTDKTINTTSEITPNYSPITTNFWSSIPSTYYYANVFEELDTFGEWFADDKSQRFYFYLPQDVNLSGGEISYKKHKGYAAEISGGNNIVIDNIDISDVDKGINITQSKNVVLQNCSISNIKSEAVRMYDTEKCGILNSEIYNVSDYCAVDISQSAQWNSELVPRRNFIQNSYINNVMKAIRISGSTGNIFSHNLIKNTAYSGVELSGAENIFEYNEFAGVANKITDAGGIYVGGDIKNRANTIRYNYFHDSRPDKKNARAIYNDDCSDMSWNYGNVVKNFSYGLFQHSGDDHVIMDNIVINAETYIRNSSNYATQEGLMKSHFFSSSPQFIRAYEENNLGSSATWQTRYKDILKKKYEQVLAAKEAYNKDGQGMFAKVYNVITKKNTASAYKNAEDVQKVCDLVADTGCYYKNNTYVVPGITYSNGYGPSSCGLYNVSDSKPTVEKNSDNYDISAHIENMGLVNADLTDESKPVIYMEQKKEFAKDEFTGVSWSGEASSYIAEIATDKNFNNIVISYVTSDKEYPVYKYVYDKNSGNNLKEKTSSYEFKVDTTYYARVRAVNDVSCAEAENTVSDTVEFILRQTIADSDNNQAQVKSYFGKTSMKIKLEGKIPDYLLNEQDRQITLMLYEDGVGETIVQSIKHIAQINAEEDGSFSYTFGGDITDRTRIRLRAGTDDITDEIFKTYANNVTEISFTMQADDLSMGNIVTAAANINNMFGVANKPSIIVASYDKSGKLIGCKKVDSDVINLGQVVEMSNEYTLPVNTTDVKAVLWNMPDMKPLAEVLD